MTIESVIWIKNLFISIDHQQSSVDNLCFNCTLCAHAISTIYCYFDFVSRHHKTHYLVNDDSLILLYILI